MAGLIASQGLGVYTTSKYAVVGLSETLVKDLRPYGIGVSVLCPMGVATRIRDSERSRPPSLRNEAAAAAAPVELIGRTLAPALGTPGADEPDRGAGLEAAAHPQSDGTAHGTEPAADERHARPAGGGREGQQRVEPRPGARPPDLHGRPGHAEARDRVRRAQPAREPAPADDARRKRSERRRHPSGKGVRVGPAGTSSGP